MFQPGDYADTLRALGRFLDDAGASEIAIVDEGDWWSVSWQRGGTRRLQFYQLDALRTVARLHRGREGDLPRLTTSQMLRTLGSRIDDAHATQFTIQELPDGFRVAGLIDGQQWEQTLSLDDLRASLQESLEAR